MAEERVEYKTEPRINITRRVDIAKVEDEVRQLNELGYRVVAAVPVVSPAGFSNHGSSTKAVILIGELIE